MIIKDKQIPPILVWNNKCVKNYLPTEMDRFWPGYPELSPNFKCPYNCTFTRDRNFETISSTIIFMLHEKCPMDGYPQNRNINQNYMFYTVESPINTIHYYDKNILTNIFFNSSATYRLDSSIIIPYDKLIKIDLNTTKDDIWDQQEVLEKIKNKTKLAFQAVSHCNAESARDNITNKLIELMPVDFVGKCNDIEECGASCYTKQLEKHFFYLAFENSICDYYITEKFWYAFRSLTVPVVLTRSVFKGIEIPENSFIAADDFLSINELIEHLKALKNNLDKYLKYFEWTKIYKKRRFGYEYSPICKVCEFATKHFYENKKLELNLNDFWNDQHCKNDSIINFLNKG